ncbi:hypothetical protein SAMN05216554_0861 [Herbiconiux ginsengi]|uniref:Uncharacterized protein n=1 Tax=Herbiconiux ginsengi TaxID=381665 RepID=A0A1H3L8P8_9MICO|nr:hypothetical protein SAMN05216554_0861 [Herbiconiux ginsengi]
MRPTGALGSRHLKENALKAQRGLPASIDTFESVATVADEPPYDREIA